MPSTPGTPQEHTRSETPDSRRNSTLDMARASHIQDAYNDQEETVGRLTGIVDALEKVAPK